MLFRSSLLVVFSPLAIVGFELNGKVQITSKRDIIFIQEQIIYL